MKFCLLFWTFLASTAFAIEEKSYEPANFIDDSFKNSIKFSNSMLDADKDRTVIINCDASISRSGRFLSNYCVQSDSAYFPYVIAINKAASAATIKPAKVDGDTKIVWFQYFIAFTKKGKNTLVEAFPNSGLQVEKLGLDYTSAQRYKEDSGNFASGCGTAYNNSILVKAVISKNGKAKNIVIDGKNVNEKCRESLKHDFEEQEFIPAFYNGVPIDSFYSEDIFNRFRKD